MLQAVNIHDSGELNGVSIENHLRELYALAENKRLSALKEALRQRYPALVTAGRHSLNLGHRIASKRKPEPKRRNVKPSRSEKGASTRR
jgi:hypothetical protein